MSEITLNRLPKTLQELQAMPQAGLTNPEEVAALTVAALALYPENPSETEKMLDFLRGPRPLNGIDKQFNKRQIPWKRVSVRSYFSALLRKIIILRDSPTGLRYQKTPTAEPR